MPDLPLIHRLRPAETGAAPYPALILLHGLGSNEEDLFSLAPAVDPRLAVISVRAPHAYGYGGYMWWDIERESAGLDGAMIAQSLERLGRFLDEAIQTYDLAPRRLHLGGFSQGAAMAGAFSLLHPERMAGTIMLSGFLPPDPQGTYRLEEASGLPIFQGHGLYDPVVSIEYARMTRDFLAHTPVALTYREYPIAHQVSPLELADLERWLEGVMEAPREPPTET